MPAKCRYIILTITTCSCRLMHISEISYIRESLSIPVSCVITKRLVMEKTKDLRDAVEAIEEDGDIFLNKDFKKWRK